MRRPRGTSGPAAGDTVTRETVTRETVTSETAAHVPHARGTALDQRIEHHLARMQGTTPPTRPGTIDDGRARRDPDTTSFAAVRPDPTDPDAGSPRPARVATAGDRRRTAAFPAVLSFD